MIYLGNSSKEESPYLFLSHCRMQKLIKPSVDRRYVDLTVSFAPEADGDEDLPGPPVRYYFSHEGKMP